MSKPFIVAELSANHNGSFERAMKLVEAAAKAGADAIKLQTWLPDSMCLDHGYVLERGQWKGRRMVDLYREAFTPWDWHKPLFKRANELGMVAFSSPFDRESVDFLETLDCQIYKIASFELVDLPLIRYVASKGKPIIMSIGMASQQEASDAVHAACSCDLTLLKCTSQYPADASEANLSTMYDMNMRFRCDVGLSDHSHGIGVAVAASALGAAVIEKHLTLSRADGGLDASFSMEPHEFAQMVTECRRAVKAIGQVKYGGELTELRRSLFYARELPSGHILEERDFRTARPATGLKPSQLPRLIGKRLAKAVEYGTHVRMHDLECI